MALQRKSHTKNAYLTHWLFSKQHLLPLGRKPTFTPSWSESTVFKCARSSDAIARISLTTVARLERVPAQRRRSRNDASCDDIKVLKGRNVHLPSCHQIANNSLTACRSIQSLSPSSMHQSRLLCASRFPRRLRRSRFAAPPEPQRDMIPWPLPEPPP